MSAIDQMIEQFGGLKGRQKEYSEQVHELNIIQGWPGWDV